MYRLLTAAFILLLIGGVSACAQDVPVTPATKQAKPAEPKPAVPRLPADKNKFAMIITGISGEETYAKKFSDWTNQLRDALTGNLGFAEEQVTILTERPTSKEQRNTAEAVRQAFVVLRNATKPDNQIFIFFIGHGSFDGKIAKFNLAGPDLTAGDYALLIDNLPARNIVVVNMASASGEFIKPLTGEGRIIVTATRSGMEQNAPKFADAFISALANPEADADKNGRVSVLEAFEYAVKLTTKSFEVTGKIVTEHALLDDNGDGVGHNGLESGDGGLAKTTYFDSLPQQQAGGDPELAKLFSERMRLEGQVEQLKARKSQMKEDEYDSALEKLLIDLARISQNIRAKQKK